MFIFNIILADPPWKHEQETGYKNAKTTRHYDVMPLEKIKSKSEDRGEHGMLLVYA